MKQENKTALLIIDVQNDYFKGGACELVDAEEALINAKHLLKLFREKKDLIIHIQHITIGSNATFFLPNTRGSKQHEEVTSKEGEHVIIKHYPNSFRETNLLEILKKEKITSLVILGMMTHMCIDATTRAAKDYGFDCTHQ